MSIKKELIYWTENFVSEYNEILGQIPCPFAKQALVKNKIRFVPASRMTIQNKLKKYASLWNDNYEAAIFYITDDISSEQLTSIVNQFNEEFMSCDFVALEDHPDDTEEINGVCMNFGYAPLILFQRLSKINKASDSLRKKGYYDNWPKENYEDVVSWRYK